MTSDGPLHAGARKQPRLGCLGVIGILILFGLVFQGLRAIGLVNDDQHAAKPAATPTADESAPPVLAALHCEEVISTPTSVVCTRGERDAVLTFTANGEPSIEEVVQARLKDAMFNEVADTFFELPQGVLYLPGAFLKESSKLAEPDDPYGAQVIDTDAYR